MRTILFVMCFSLGVSLMVLSGYLPKTASARGGGDVDGGDSARRVLVPRYYPDITPRPVETAPATTTVPEPASPAEPYFDPTSERQPTTGDDGLTPPPTPVATEPNSPPPYSARHKRDHGPRPSAAAATSAAGAATGPAEPNSPDADKPAPVAEAGTDRVTWIGWNEIVLDGSASTGEGLTYRWKQVAGPADLQIKRPGRAKVSATGLPISAEMEWASALYEFELTVTDRQGREATDKVGVVVLSGPELKIMPIAQRHFEVRDGYMLGHYEAWAASAEGEGVTFRIASPVGLTFTKVAGTGYEVASEEGREGGGGRGEGRGSAGGRHVYKVTVYPDPNELAAYVELLVDTDEKVPGIVRLGVTWER